MNEREVQRRMWLLGHARYRVFLPNYTPKDWWECDMFGVTKAGYFHEYEIKLTRADFMADAKKERKRWGAWGTPPVLENKHELLTARSVNGPALFWYVVPEGLVDASEVPEWAGLQMWKKNHNYATVVKDAPRLHRTKIDQAIIEHALGVCYFRYWHARNELAKYQEATA